MILVVVICLLGSNAATTREVVGEGIVVPSLERNASRVETLIVDSHDLFSALLSNDNTGVTPREVVLVPERVHWKDERIDGEGEDVDDHPSDMLPLTFEDEDKCLKTIHGCYHNDGDQWEWTGMTGNQVDEVPQVYSGRWQDDCTEKINKHDESHTETAETAHFLDPDQFSQIVDGRVDPSTSLR